jgi:hypothetical protein
MFRGVFTYPDGGSYSGEWKSCKKHGRGALTSQLSFKARDLIMFFKGTRVWADGSRYEGEWYDDAKQGRGSCVYAVDGGSSGYFLRCCLCAITLPSFIT